jgi:uncharacterized membrane protein
MKSFSLSGLSVVLFAVFLLSVALRGHNDTTTAVVASSLLMFACCLANAMHLLGKRLAWTFALMAMAMGWFAEQMGATHGWFFGHYTYTDVLGWRIGAVPAVIPMMWFALSYIAFVLGNLIVLRSPMDNRKDVPHLLFMSFLAAMLVTAFDLGADPYMVNVLKAWVMDKKDGGWFGETLQGFVGWMTVSFAIQCAFRWQLRRGAKPPGADFTRWHALLALGLYASGMVFQMCLGEPVETRTIAFFAMGIPLLCAIAGWQHWTTVQAQPAASPVSEARLDQMQYMADPLADDTMERLLNDGDSTNSVYGENRFARIAAVNAEMRDWTSNQSIANWQPSSAALPQSTRLALQAYLAQGQALPDWADAKKLRRAETLFMDYGPLSCTLLFCASLPECYVIPDLSAVLHATGQLDKHTDYRIRSTAAMIFPVMMKGGLTDPKGGGVAQILKVRLIHATIRHLLLRQCPATAMTGLGDQRNVTSAGIVPATTPENNSDMAHTVFANGWKLGADGLPCNQEELAYTLLTFGYVFLRSMRQLGQAFSPSDEAAYLHCWNVVGHVLGIRKELMPDTMAQAQAMMAQMQMRGRANPFKPDPRPQLGRSLMNAVSNAIPLAIFKPFPVLLTQYLCGAQTIKDIGLHQDISLLSKGFFYACLGSARLFDHCVQWVFPQFSLSRLLTRVLGYHLMCKVLLDETRPLQLPEHLQRQVRGVMATWGNDAQASASMNRLEDKLTRVGSWSAAAATHHA